MGKRMLPCGWAHGKTEKTQAKKTTVQESPKKHIRFIRKVAKKGKSAQNAREVRKVPAGAFSRIYAVRETHRTPNRTFLRKNPRFSFCDVFGP